MSTITKWVIGIAVIAGAGWLLWWSGWLGTPAQAPAATSSNATSTAPTNGMSASNDTSDAALSQDSAAVDAQLQALSADSANVDSSINDQPVQQDY